MRQLELERVRVNTESMQANFDQLSDERKLASRPGSRSGSAAAAAAADGESAESVIARLKLAAAAAEEDDEPAPDEPAPEEPMAEGAAAPAPPWSGKALTMAEAAAAGDAAALEALLAAGGEAVAGSIAAADTRGWLPLHHAAAHGRGGCVALLLGAGAVLGAKDRDGATALHRAVTQAILLLMLMLLMLLMLILLL